MTTSTNPYAAPSAAVADVHPDSTEAGTLRMWSPRGRIGRLRYLAWGMGAYLLFFLLTALLPLLAGWNPRGAGAVLVGLLFIPMLVLWVFWAIQRAHDMDHSAWLVLFMFIPLLNVIWALVWLFGRGTPHANRFGPPPPPNSLGVKIIGSVMPALLVLGLVLSIAMPDRHGPAKRAQAPQVSR